MSIEQGLEPLVKSVVVPTTPERAFRLFTAEFGRWWPLATHSVRREEATDVRLEGAVGGQIVEYDASGPVGSWGTVSDWDPPHTVSFTWHPGSDPKQAGHVTVRFTANSPDGGSRERGGTGEGTGSSGDGSRSGDDASENGDGSSTGDGSGESGGTGEGSGTGGASASGDGSARGDGGSDGDRAADRGGTLVELTHTGWERRPDGVRARVNYDSGWDFVLRRFVQFRP